MVENNKEIKVGSSFYYTAFSNLLPIPLGFAYYLLAPPEYIYSVVLLGFAIIALYGVYQALRIWSDDKTLFSITDDGLVDNVQGYGLIPWPAIKHARIFGHPTVLLCIHLLQPDKFGSERENQSFHVKTKSWGAKGDIFLDITSINIKSGKLLEEINKRIPEANKAVFAAELGEEKLV